MKLNLSLGLACLFAMLSLKAADVRADELSESELENNTTDKAIMDACIFSAIKATKTKTTLAEIEQQCEDQIAANVLDPSHEQTIELGAITHRVMREKRTAADPYVLTAHKMNYMLPLSIVNEINRDAYQDIEKWSENLKDSEAKFQVSLKIPLLTNSLINDGDQFYFGFTLQSWWQIYSEDISRPFRETNYQPEFFYFTPINVHPFGGNSALIFGFEHQSNGRSQLISRSWNRVYINYLYEKRNFALSLRPWYRIPEGDKATSLDGEGDDNPDILDYMGHFELELLYKHDEDYELSFMSRNNFATHKGFVELGITFPLWGKLKGYAQLSSGYGESMIDYNVNQKRFGIGIALTNLL
jgi:phospholipase A1